MLESRSEATDRLRREGRWSEANAFKDTIISKCRGDGMKRLEAQEQGWQAMLERYPPIEPTNLLPELLGDDVLPPAMGNQESGDFVASVLWVFDHLDRDVSPAESPSAGAWSLLKWARANQDDYFKSLVPRALDIRAKQGAGDVDGHAMEEQIECESIAELLGISNYIDQGNQRGFETA